MKKASENRTRLSLPFFAKPLKMESSLVSSSLHLQPAYRPPPKAAKSGPWLEAESNTLRVMVKQNYTPEQCATRLRRPIKSIKVRAIALGVPFTQKED